MIPILYDSTEINFTSNGLGRLSDAISCEVKEQRNGIFELEFTYPISGINYHEIDVNKIVYCMTEEGGNNQQFIIYKRTKPLNGIVTFNAQHISYLLNSIPCMPFEGSDIADTLSKIPTYAAITCPFTFTTDISSSVDFKLEEPREIRSLLGGERGSILDVYGQGDYKFDNYQVSLLADRGNDNGVSIRYGKNLTELQDVLDSTSTYTGICPYWRSTEGDLKTLPEKVIYSSEGATYPYKIIRTIDFSGDFENEPTDDQLRTRAEQYINSNKGWRLKNNLKVSFVSLYDTEEYKNFAPLERVKLCDTVHIVYENIDVKAKVIETNFDVLQERYTSIELGDTTYSLAQAVAEAAGLPTEQQVNSRLQNAIEHATKLIQGGLGGHVVFNTNANGEPEEILIMDTDSIETAVNVIRMNLGGIGFSHNGYAGPFDTAWTIDGNFVADYITTGTLDGGLIRADTIQASALSLEAKTELNAIHDYAPYDLFDNISRWEIDAKAVYFESMLWQGEQYTALAMDGTDIHQYTPSYSTQFKTDIIGKVEFTIKFSFMFEQAINSTQEFAYLYYYSSDDNAYHSQSIQWLAGDYEAYHRYEREHVITPTSTVSLETGYYPRIGFRFVPDTITLLSHLSITGPERDYNYANLQFDENGLSSIVQSGSIISAINQSAETVSISANKINLTGDLDLRGNFRSYDPNDNTNYSYLDDSSFKIYSGGYPTFAIYPYFDNTHQARIQFYDSEIPYPSLQKTVIEVTSIDTHYLSGVDLTVKDATIGQSGSGTFDVSATSWFYANVYNANGSVVFVSDQRKKKNIKDLAIKKARSFIMGLKPREFKFKKPISTSDRKHHGFIAQEVKKVMPEDFGIYVENEEKDFIGLRYDEFIADMVAVMQDQQKRIEELERRLNDFTDNKS